MVTPVHRFQSIENGPIQHMRRQNQSISQTRQPTQQSSLTTTVSNTTSTLMSAAPQSAEVDSSIYIEASTAEGNVDAGQQSQLIRLGGLIKYGMWASFGLITVSVAVTKFFINHQGTFEMLLLCTLGMLSVGLLGSCILSVCRTKAAPEFVTIQQQPHRTEVEIQEIMSHREETILPVEIPASAPQQTVVPLNPTASPETEQPPPPYHIAILLPPKERRYEDLPPPSYENAMR